MTTLPSSAYLSISQSNRPKWLLTNPVLPQGRTEINNFRLLIWIIHTVFAQQKAALSLMRYHCNTAQDFGPLNQQFQKHFVQPFIKIFLLIVPIKVTFGVSDACAGMLPIAPMTSGFSQGPAGRGSRTHLWCGDMGSPGSLLVTWAGQLNPHLCLGAAQTCQSPAFLIKVQIRPSTTFYSMKRNNYPSRGNTWVFLVFSHQS